MHPVGEQEGGKLRDRAPVIMRVDGVVHRVADERAEIMREAVGVDALALDQAGIAVAGFLARRAPVDQQGGPPGLLEMKRDRNADDTGAENDRIHLHDLLLPTPFPARIPVCAGLSAVRPDFARNGVIFRNFCANLMRLAVAGNYHRKSAQFYAGTGLAYVSGR